MKLIKKLVYNHGIIWDIKNNVGGWVYLYNKGCFRDFENYVVISISYTGGSCPADRENIRFNTKKKALNYLKTRVV
ncbi:MAG: hypothetical protein AABY22_15160 [Nanoarchaeota archaeon]